MTLFDVYVMTDWSAASSPTKPGSANTIWIASLNGADRQIENFTTRMSAMAYLKERFSVWIAEGARVLAGFDFSFGYPAGAAAAITGEASWQALWGCLAERIEDDEANRNNRFDLAHALNEGAFAGEPKFWGRPTSRADLTSLPARKEVGYTTIAEHRVAETFFSRAQPVWKMFTTGSVGGQSMMGIKHLEDLRRSPSLRDYVTIWPFETAFEQGLPQGPGVLVAELYPSAIPINREGEEVLDKAQVRSVVDELSRRDHDGTLRELLAPPTDISDEQRALMLAEEGSIVGAGRLARRDVR